MMTRFDSRNIEIERDKKTAAALAEAKQALISYAVIKSESTKRPGDFPCPDIDYDGIAEISCGNTVGSTNQKKRLGWLPWKTLGIGDIRDGNGDRLWYAVSNNFKNNTKKLPLNSDTLGTIHLKNNFGKTINVGGTESGIAALVISPGVPIIRQDNKIQQRNQTTFRSAHIENIATEHLEIAFDEDNANFLDGDNDINLGNGFIAGVIKNSKGEVILNDLIIPIIPSDFMPSVEKVVLNQLKLDLIGMGGMPTAVPFLNPSLIEFFAPKSNNIGLLPVHPYYWELSGKYKCNGCNKDVIIQDLKSGFIEPGYCFSESGFVKCYSSKKLRIDNRDILIKKTIEVEGELDEKNKLNLVQMKGKLNISLFNSSDGSLLGSGDVVPDGNALKISIQPIATKLFSSWLVENNWHHFVRYFVSKSYLSSDGNTLCNQDCFFIREKTGLTKKATSLLMMAGKKLNVDGYNQQRPSGDCRDYFDTVNNKTDGLLFDGFQQIQKIEFNDQLLVVLP
jgi:hypothetical protein